MVTKMRHNNFNIGWILALALIASGAHGADDDVCERLLYADLSGHYVFTNLKSNKSALIQLRRMGDSAAYTVSTFRIKMPERGVRELRFERLPVGWLMEDSNKADRRANVMNLQREDQNVVLRFEDLGDATDFYYLAKLGEHENAIKGDILRPGELEIQFHRGANYRARMTRIHFDKTFEAVVSPFLKVALATRLDQENAGPDDLMIIVDLKTPVTVKEAAEMLGSELLQPFDDSITKTDRFSRFAVPKNLYEFLEAAPKWTRLWEVAAIDAIPTRLLNVDFVRSMNNVSRVGRSSFAPPVQPQPQPQAETAQKETKLP